MTSRIISEQMRAYGTGGGEVHLSGEHTQVEPQSTEAAPPWKILVVDDEEDIHRVTKLTLQQKTYNGRKFEFHSAFSGQEACAFMAQHPDVAVVLLDVVMESSQAGLEFVKYLRESLQNRRTRIILRTGQPGEAPEELIIREYDINDYRTKAELTHQKLYTSVILSLRTYEQLLAFEANQREMELLYRHIRERNYELQRAKDLAEAANLAKDEFLSLMNHELRTPLNVILMRSEILDNGIYGHLTAKQKKSLDLIRNSGHHLLSIIDDILDLASIENGELTVNKHSISAIALCEQSIRNIQELIQYKKLDARCTTSAEGIQICADEHRMLQILDKLLKNAIKFSDEGGTIGVEIRSNDVEGVAFLTVWDKGIGIEPTDILRSFQPFVQLERSLTRRYEGTGLGLTIASRLVQLMDGEITVESAPGQGSKFTITLPLADADSQPAAESAG